jgi:hypothetical protein
MQIEKRGQRITKKQGCIGYSRLAIKERDAPKKMVSTAEKSCHPPYQFFGSQLFIQKNKIWKPIQLVI